MKADSSLWAGALRGVPMGVAGQGPADRAHPSAPTRSRAAGGHQDSPSPSHWAPSWEWGWMWARRWAWLGRANGLAGQVCDG